jgi:TRAP-type C4-dicarboxylate transport system permease small subunit
MKSRKTGQRLVSFLQMVYRYPEGFLMTVLTFLLVTDVLLGILARFVHFEVVFATELGKYLFIWLCAIGISAAAKDNQHVRIHFIVTRLPINPKITWIFTQLLFLIFSFFLLYWGFRLTVMHYQMHKLAMGFHFPMFIFTAALPVGFALTSFRLTRDILTTLKKSTCKTGWDTRLPEGISELPDEF